MENKKKKNNNDLFQEFDMRFQEATSLFSEETLTFMKQLSINGGESYLVCIFGETCNFGACSFNNPCQHKDCDFGRCDWAITTLPPTPTPGEIE